jgi:hypothetical protein
MKKIRKSWKMKKIVLKGKRVLKRKKHEKDCKILKKKKINRKIKCAKEKMKKKRKTKPYASLASSHPLRSQKYKKVRNVRRKRS